MSDAINLGSPNWDPADSYGRIACELAWHLAAAGQRVNALSPRGVLRDGQSDALQALLRQPVRAALGGIVLGYPTNFGQFGALAMAGPRVAVTMFESTRLPAGWVEALNACRAVVVPSRWAAAMFRENGVSVPITRIPLGISATFRPALRPAGRRPFTFLCIADRWRRKGWDLAVQAFHQAFGEDPAYRLVLKARRHGFPIEIGHPCVEIVREDLSEDGMQALYARCDAMAAPTRGEGLYLPPLEFAATGGMFIVTGWSGPADYAHLGYRLRYRMVRAWSGYERFAGQDLGEWAEPELDHLVRQMQFVAQQAGPVAWARAWRNARTVRELYDWRRFAAGVLGVWREVTQAEAPQRGVRHGKRHATA